MKLRAPIYARVLLWFLVNLLLLATLGYGFMHMQFRLGLDWMLAGPTGERIQQIANSLTDDLSRKPENEWPAALQRHATEQGVAFALFSSDGQQVLGERVEVPREVRGKLIDKRAPGDRPPPPRRPAANPSMRPPKGDAAPPKPRFILRSENPTRYWAGIHIDLLYHEGPVGFPLTLVMISDSLTGGGLILDPWPWIYLAAGGLLLSTLVWLPFVSGMTRSIERLNIAARSIAHGRFEDRVPEKRRDELGELAASVNAMAAQLGDYVAQQRRITADVAHELCSPIARMQMALGILEQRGTPEQSTYLKKLDAELQHMAKLVEEVLTFSKAATLPEREAPTGFDLRELIDQVIAREAPETEIQRHVDDLQLHTLRAALDRALGNVLRNAVRYASQIEIHATQQNDQVVIQISDQGPGVPVEALPRLFEPFYRPEAARGRNTGGSGLGLAITKRCMQACDGSVTAQNLASVGFVVELRLPPDFTAAKSLTAGGS